MNLRIDIKGIDEFVYNQIPLVLTDYINKYCDDLRCAKLNEYLVNKLGIHSNVREILKYCISNLTIVKDLNGYLIRPSTTKYIPNTNYAIDSIVRLIDSGNMEIKGYNILSQAFNYVKGHIHLLLYVYNGK